MKKIAIIMSLFLTVFTAYGQDAESYYNQGIEKAQKGEMDKAIKLFDKSIELNPEVYISWYNRGIAKSILDNYQGALIDFDQVIKLQPDYKKAYLNRGTTKKKLTDYEGALTDYSHSIKLDQNFADAYYNRGLLYEMLNKKDSACLDFQKAFDLGLKAAERKIEKCNDTTETHIETYSILYLTRTAKNKKYGFTSDNPIKVGKGPNGGPANQRAYMDLLRDQQGNPIKYERIGSCCAYDSPNAIFGKALVDIYEIKFVTEKGKKKKEVIYISFYDYEEPMILYGFKTIEK